MYLDENVEKIKLNQEKRLQLKNYEDWDGNIEL